MCKSGFWRQRRGLSILAEPVTIDIAPNLFMLSAEALSQISRCFRVYHWEFHTFKAQVENSVHGFPELDSEQQGWCNHCSQTSLQQHPASLISCQVFYDCCWNIWVKVECFVLPSHRYWFRLKVRYYKLLVEMKDALYIIASLLFLLSCSKRLVSDHF